MILRYKNEPFILAVFAIVPLIVSDPYVLGIMILFFIWVIVVMYWNLVLGNMRLNVFGQPAFFLIGGYVSSWLAVNAGISPLIGLLAGGSAAALVSLIVVRPTIRLKGMYIALVTLAFQQALQSALLMTQLTPYTGGSWGIQFVPPFELGPLSTATKSGAYYLGLLFFGVSLVFARSILVSRLGLAATAIGDNETLASSIGIDMVKIKMLVFAASAFFTGMAGVFWACYQSNITPVVLDFSYLVSFLVMMVMGGIGSLYGSVIGALLITILLELLRVLTFWRYLIIGLLLIGTTLVTTKGIAGVYAYFQGILKGRIRNFSDKQRR